jgi:hypothetical protein
VFGFGKKSARETYFRLIVPRHTDEPQLQATLMAARLK